MKKLVIAAGVFTMVVGCKKENMAVNPTSKTDTFTTPNQADHSVSKGGSMALAEISPAKLTENLRAKKNDTLYITNFFATWCGPCILEIPHFKEKMDELKGQPVKFIFVSLDEKSDWNEGVKNFAEDKGIIHNTLLLNGAELNPEFFSANFKTWKGETIPFTLMKKGGKTEEIEGSITKEVLEEKIKSFK